MKSNLKIGDSVVVFMRGTTADAPERAIITAIDPSGVCIVKNADGMEDEVFINDIKCKP